MWLGTRNCQNVAKDRNCQNVARDGNCKHAAMDGGCQTFPLNFKGCSISCSKIFDLILHSILPEHYSPSRTLHLTIRANRNSPHDLLFQGSSGYQSVHIDNFLLPDAVSTIHCLQVLHWIPVMLNKYNLSKHAEECHNTKYLIMASSNMTHVFKIHANLDSGYGPVAHSCDMMNHQVP